MLLAQQSSAESFMRKQNEILSSEKSSNLYRFTLALY